MSTSIHSRIVRVAQIAQRNARSSDEHDVAVALLDELAGVEVVVKDAASIVVGPVPATAAAAPAKPKAKKAE